METNAAQNTIPVPPIASSRKMRIWVFGALIAIVIIAAIIAGVLGWIALQQKQSSLTGEISALKNELASLNSKLEKGPQPADLLPELKKNTTSDFQAVHLTDKIIYFGKVVEYNTNTVRLTDVYYIQGGYTDPAQALPAGTYSQSQMPMISLVKRGSELHAPTDEMVLNTVNVTFIENLKPDSRVYQAIKDYERQ